MNLDLPQSQELGLDRKKESLFSSQVENQLDCFAFYVALDIKKGRNYSI